MTSGDLGRTYQDGELIIEQGTPGDCMFVIQEGEVEVILRRGDRQVRLATRGQGEIFGEMALFEKEVRLADVRAIGKTRVLTIDRRNFMTRVHEDPSLAFRLVQMLSARVRELSNELSRLKEGE